MLGQRFMPYIHLLFHLKRFSRELSEGQDAQVCLRSNLIDFLKTPVKENANDRVSMSANVVWSEKMIRSSN